MANAPAQSLFGERTGPDLAGMTGLVVSSSPGRKVREKQGTYPPVLSSIDVKPIIGSYHALFP